MMSCNNDANSIELEKCKGLLMSGLSKIQQQQHHNALPLTSSGSRYLEGLLLKLLSSLLCNQPKTVQDAKDQVSRKFPEPLSKWALEEAESAQEKGKKKVAFPVDKLHHALKEYNSGMEKQVTLIFSGVLEYMASDILKLTTNYAKNISSSEINDQDIKIAMFADNVLMDVFHCDDDIEEEMVAVPEFPNLYESEKKVSYESLVRDFMSDEASYLRDLNLIIKLIKKEFDGAPELFSEKEIDTIFSNITDLAELSEKLIGLLEEAVEMTDESSPVPLVGSCFEDLAVECSFDLYSDYTIARMGKEWRETFDSILSKSAVTSHLQNVCSGFRDVVAYVLPNLLLAPIYHCFFYLEQIELLEKNSPDPDDKQCFIQARSAVTPIRPVLEARTQSLPKLRPSEASLRKSWKGGPSALQMSDIEKSIDGWWGRTITQSCNEFLYEGGLQRVSRANKRNSDRHVFLFDSLLISCKSNQARLPTVSTQYEYRLKERILIRKATVRDVIGESEDSKLRFEVIDGEKSETYVFHAKTIADKQAWMAHLVRLRYRSTFDRMLDQIVREEAANQELRLPSPEKYRFAEPDSPENLILEKSEAGSQVDLIKGGTVLKLVERLTYHKYSDPRFTKTFLITFRSFCKPKELLDLLMERYRIPEPLPTEEQQMAIDRGELPNREDLKRFREEYFKPIQLRVMNVIRQWLERHWYDFEGDEKLLAQVEEFISSVRGKNMKKWARTIQKIAARKKDLEEPEPTVEFSKDPPPVEWHLTRDPSKFNIFTLHPIEIARQLTLIEFDLYRKVQCSEMVGSVWTKAGKETNSPNLLKMIHFSTKITRWVSKTIMEINNLNERLAAMSRAIEIMLVMKQLNNFNGLLEFVAAFHSAAVHRLNFTREALSDNFSKSLAECMEMCDSRLMNMFERLQSIDPPCVPFFGTFLTNILKTEEGNPHLLPNQPEHFKLINFSKRRKVVEIILQVQQYQNQHYNLKVVPEIRDFFINLDPIGGKTDKEFRDHLFHSSLKVEPREVERPPKFPKVFSEKEIKSPGIVAGKRHITRTTTKEDVRQSDKPMPTVKRHVSLRADLNYKRHSLYETPTPKTMSFDTMSVKSFAVQSSGPMRTPSPKDESPPPRPPREPRSSSILSSDLVSAPPTMSQQSRFSFELPTRLSNFPSLPARNSPVPPTPATAPARTSIPNGAQHFDPGQISPPATQLMHGNGDSTPPPIPPRDRINGSFADRPPLYTKSVDRTSPPAVPPPIPPRDPVRPFPPHYNRNMDIHQISQHMNGRYVADPTQDRSPAMMHSSSRTSMSAQHSFDTPAPPYSERDPRNHTPTSFAFPEPHQAPNRITHHFNFNTNGGNLGINHNSNSSEVPPPIPRRQPSSNGAS